VSIVKPFRALRPLPERAADVSAVPYDVVNADEARALAAGNPLSFLHVSRPEIDLPEGIDPYSERVYQKAAENFDRLIAQAPLVIEDEPSFYLYRLSLDRHSQTGLVACCSIDEYDRDIILKHEKTRRDKEDDRTRHILTLRAQTGPVFLTYRPQTSITSLVASLTNDAPLFDFTSVDGVSHTVWRVSPGRNEDFAAYFGEVPRLYIADGHHRAKSASRAREELRGAASTGEEDFDFFQCVIFPADEVRILPYNRVVKDLNGQTQERFLEEVARNFIVSADADPAPAARARIAMYLGGRWYDLRLRGEVTNRLQLTSRLDVSLLQDHLLAPVLAVQDPRTDKRIDFVGGIRGTRELERLVDEGSAAVAFSLHPTTVEELMEIADAGEVMPPKSTWFEPKLRDGLLSHLI
jgi:uncharacterized protein (DUF1015 family)